MGVGSFILPQIGGTKEWQRPSDWLPMPTNITETRTPTPTPTEAAPYQA